MYRFFFFPRRKCFLTFVFYLNVLYVEYAFRIYIPLHIKKHYFIHFCCLFLKLSNAFSVSLSLLYFGKCSTELAQLAPLPYSRGRSTRYSDRLHDFSVTIPRCYKDVYVNSFFSCTFRLWNSLPIECFPLTYYLNDFKSRINRHLLTVGSF